VTGNYAWLNWITIVAIVAALPDGFLGILLPVSTGLSSPAPWFAGVVIALAVVVVVLSYWPVRNLLSHRQLMNASFDPLRLVNSYGAFGAITRERFEVVVEGTDEPEPTPATVWREYEFKGKPGDPRRRLPQVAPYHLRLDWLMWFAAMSSPLHHPWLLALAEKLLENDRPTLRLLSRNPFPDRPPTFVRASLYRYRFTTWRERRETGAWWARSRVGEYLPPLRLAPRTRGR
jgi:hypothetical protein